MLVLKYSNNLALTLTSVHLQLLRLCAFLVYLIQFHFICLLVQNNQRLG